MNSAVRWFDRLRERAKTLRENAAAALPGLVETLDIETEDAFSRAEVFIVPRSEMEQMLAHLDAPEDLRMSFSVPFRDTFFIVEEPANVPSERGEGIRGILVSEQDGHYRVRAWFEERHPSALPRYDFTLAPRDQLLGPQNRIADLLYWLSGYISSPGLVAIRHNPRHEAVRRHRASGRPSPGCYYTFSVVEQPKRRRRRRFGEPAPRLTSVHGHFRRAHWHTLPSGRGTAWYPTTWVRPYKRRLREAHDVQIAA